MMNPVRSGRYQYPDGYGVCQNSQEQGVDPATGRTIPTVPRFAISSDEMNQATKMLREHLVGEQLSAITFVMDYLQFDFHGKRLTVFTKPKADIYNEDIPNFRDRLCAFITREVTSVEEVSGDAIRIDFGRSGRLTIPLDDDSRVQVEAAYLSAQQKTLWTW
jgi:hypothetical protein